MRFVFHIFGAYFSTRERGVKVRDEINEALRRTSEDLLILDFDGVQLISFSFADEVVGRLVSDRASGEMGDVSILIVNANDEVIHPIQSSMERRKLVVASLRPDGIRLIGAPEHVAATFRVAKSRGEFRTPELAADLGITVQAANNRLKQLLACGLLVRRPGIPQAGGKEYVYRVALPSEPMAA